MISHEGVRQTVRGVAEHIQAEDKRLVYQKDGRQQVRVVFIEAYGLSVALRRKGGKKEGERRRETKLAVVHEG